MKTTDFFGEHPVFSVQEFDLFLKNSRPLSNRTREALLSYHVKAGHLVRLKKGLYATARPGTSPISFIADPYLVLSKLQENVVIGYHTALAFYGKSHTVTHQFCGLTHRRPLQTIIQQNRFHLVSFPQSLIRQHQSHFGVKVIPYQGSQLQVTSFERTLVDMLDRPLLTGEWEEIWRSLESVDYFDIEKILEYTLILNTATTTALVGFYLEQHRQALSVTESVLNQLQKYIPKKPHYASRHAKTLPCRFVARWNLMIPNSILEKSWEESI